MPLLIIFILVPLIELAVLIKVGSYIGVLWTFALIILTAIVGVQLLRAQGLSTLIRAQDKLQQGSIPAQELAEGFLLAFAGALMLTPGFVTDAFGFALLLPVVRASLVDSVLKILKPRMSMRGTFTQTDYSADQRQQRPPVQREGDHDVIEGDYRRED